VENVAGYSEATEQGRVSAVPLSHLSIEVGHFLMGELVNGVDQIRAQFRSIAPIIEGCVRSAEIELGCRPRVSTCFLIDDYFRPETDPTMILDKVLGIARECGLTIDYLAREAGCATVPAVTRDGVVITPSIALAEIVRQRIVSEPREWEKGRTPPPTQSGWLCNGTREVTGTPGQAMHPEQQAAPAVQFGRRGHSIFLDVEMSSATRPQVNGRPVPEWSCPYLASIWQLLRLGMLRFHGKPVVEPQPWNPDVPWPARWADMPSVVQLNPHAKPFAAYRSHSILPQRYLEIEHAVRVILDHTYLDPEVVEQVVSRGIDEGVEVPIQVVKRLSHYLFAGS